jgi:acetyl-CoA carboxylase biotin carboxyl carrier protein
MELSRDDVLQILELLRASDLDYLEVQLGATRLIASRSGILPGGGPPQGRQASPPAEASPQATGPPPGTQSERAAPRDPDLVAVPAPIMGTFFRAPSPGEPPFVEPGALVEEDSATGIIEVMKVFNSVLAGVRGEVVEILAQDGEFVEYGQHLLLIRPTEA